MLWKETAAVRALGLRIPLLLFVAPSVLELDDEGAASASRSAGARRTTSGRSTWG